MNNNIVRIVLVDILIMRYIPIIYGILSMIGIYFFK